MAQLRSRIPDTDPVKMAKFEQREADLLQTLYGKTRAGFWLDNREKTAEAVLDVIWSQLKARCAA
jgi:hypothetical protein